MKGGLISRAQEEMKGIWNLLKDSIFPVYCIGCKREGEWVCNTCYETLDITGVFCCPVCHSVQELGRCCAQCVKNSSLDEHRAVMAYKEQTIISHALHTFKYHYAYDELIFFKRLIVDFIARYPLYADVIIPVPLHRRRYVERGFNQSLSFAQLLSGTTNIPVREPLERKRYTIQQAKLDREGRLSNVKDAFCLRHGMEESLQGKHIVIVDDVFTTGTTMQECARVLKENGASKVTGFTIARG